MNRRETTIGGSGLLLSSRGEGEESPDGALKSQLGGRGVPPPRRTRIAGAAP